jgi:hypothetical protein
MFIVPTNPVERDFVIDCFLEDWDHGRATAHDAYQLRAELRQQGDVARLERVARRIAARG